MTRTSPNGDDAHETTTSDIIDDLRAIARDAEALLRATEGEAGERIAKIRARAEESLAGAKERLRDIGANAEKVRSAAHSTDKYVRDNPWAAVAIAVGIGFLIGSVGRRR
jgi:ElaB/YqjD/DUF883 family membrane-anchored ribosome-binding protein